MNVSDHSEGPSERIEKNNQFLFVLFGNTEAELMSFDRVSLDPVRLKPGGLVGVVQTVGIQPVLERLSRKAVEANKAYAKAVALPEVLRSNWNILP